MHLDVTGRELGVVGPLAFDDSTLNGNDKLASQDLCFSVRKTGVLFVQHDLRNTITIAKINKRQNAEIALACDPAHENDLGTGMGQSQFTAGMSSFKIA